MRTALDVRRVIVAVRPRLLADTLVRALAGPQVEVVVDSDRSRVPGSYDVAVVSGDLPEGVRADAVVRLPEASRGAEGSVTTVAGTEPVVVGDLASLLETLHRFLGTH